MTDDQPQEPAPARTNNRSPGYLTHLVLCALAVTVAYFAGTPEVTRDFTERQERDFHVAAARAAHDSGKGGQVFFALSHLRSGKVDLEGLSFLLPAGEIRIDVEGHDLHKVTVLERHADWQLIEYVYGNSHTSVSRYRAYKDRVEPVSYRVTMHFGLFVFAIVALIAALLASTLVNAVWNALARRNKGPEAA